MAKILVLGGSYFQIDFIDSALEHGHEVFVIDRDPNCLASGSESSVFINVDFSDFEKLKNLCLSERFDAILSPANEFGNRVAARLSKIFDLYYNSEKVVNISSDKYLLREELSGKGVLFPRHKRFYDDYDNLTTEFNFPVIVKPSNSAGSRGISAAYTENDLSQAYNYAKNNLSEGGVVFVEEIIEGTQYSIETITYSGKHYVAGIVLEKVSGPPNFIERCHFTGPDIYRKNIHLFQPFINELLDNVGIKVGPCHIEVIIKDNSIYLVEMASRSGGLRHSLLKYASGTDYNMHIINSYLGKDIDESSISAPSRDVMVGLLMYEDDLKTYIAAKKNNDILEEFILDKKPEPLPRTLLDVFGYFYAYSVADVFEYCFCNSVKNDRE